MRSYYLDPNRCAVSINPKRPVKIKDIDILVMTGPEYPEDFYTIVEGMLDGVPVILPRTEVTTEFIANGITGVLFSTNDELYSVLEYLISDPMLREEIGLAARNSLPSNTDVEAIVALMLLVEDKNAHS